MPQLQEEKNNISYLQSYCFTAYGKFFVSTIHRRSSAALAYDNWYYETLAWKLNEDDTRSEWSVDHSGAVSEKQARIQHNEVVEQLFELGKFNDIDE